VDEAVSDGPLGAPVSWSQLGRYVGGVSHPVVAVHRDTTGHGVPGIALGSVRAVLPRVARDWLTLHVLTPSGC
jgi:hypothetical protein